jgi:hypothetical protein
VETSGFMAPPRSSHNYQADESGIQQVSEESKIAIEGSG